ncbi:MAG: hypothetical protein RI897_1239 [Verrucomicrobiota bacterium]|jgi:signal transduction histidine kinase
MTAKDAAIHSPEFLASYREDESNVRIRTGKLACALVFVLMPAGVLLDLTVYPKLASEFLWLRLLCSLLISGIWGLHFTRFARKHYQWVGIAIPILPVLFMTYMIYVTEGPRSPYYAGLNLVLLAISAVGHWSTRESVITSSLVLAIYVLGVSAHVKNRTSNLSNPGASPITSTSQSLIPNLTPPSEAYSQQTLEEDLRLIPNNLFFIALTGIIVVAGNTIFSRLRLREFTLRYELNQNQQELEENHQKLLELDQAKSHFFANISHELRTPLTLLLAPLENLLIQSKNQNDDEAHDLLSTMQANGMRLLKLINDLLDLVRLESGRMEVRREVVELSSYLNGLLNAVRPVAQSKKVNLIAKYSPELGSTQIDRDKVEKILLNLLFNALKFTDSDGSVALIATHDKNQLTLAVQDSGMGIPKSQLPNVFGRFWQADSSARRKHQGAGIGLALVKELAEVQDGSVSVDSVEGQGSTFTVKLPWIESSETAESPASTSAPNEAPDKKWLENLYRRAELFPASNPSALAKQATAKPAIPLTPNILTTNANPLPSRRTQHRILVADDEPDMLRFLQHQLSRFYTVDPVSNGREAVEHALSTPPDLILLDMMMPELDGIQTCQTLRQQKTTRNLPIVLLTARADEETKISALSVGANDFLTKPFSITELEVRVHNLIQNHVLQLQLSDQNTLLQSTIEQLKETEVQLVQAEKLASLGRLSAGIIHEINNPLNFAASNLYSLRRSADQTPESIRPTVVECLDDMETALNRVRDIVSNLRSFTHAGGGVIETINLQTTLETALRFLSHELRDEIQLVNRIPDNLNVQADRNRFLQVLINLLQNAVDAIKQNPNPTQPGTIWLDAFPKDHDVLLTVTDNGPGIAPEIQDKIFDPFFTTKEVGKGLGLGLSISYRIIQQLNGHLSVSSKPGQLTEMQIRLPAAKTA